MAILQRNDSVEAATDQLLIDSLLTSDGSGGRLKALALKELLRRGIDRDLFLVTSSTTNIVSRS